MKIDPIHQFNIEPLFTIGHIGNHTIAFTNSTLYMFLSVAVISPEWRPPSVRTRRRW